MRMSWLLGMEMGKGRKISSFFCLGELYQLEGILVL